MSNSKDDYSDASKFYCEVLAKNSPVVKSRYDRSKEREQKYNENWKKFMVNLNDLVDKYAPNAMVNIYKNKNDEKVKFEWKGELYTVCADKCSGCVRVHVNNKKIYFDINGNVSFNGNLTHFKIKKKGEI